MTKTEPVAEESGDTADPTLRRSCFMITPIGNTGSRERRRADGLLNGVIKPIFDSMNVGVTRADTIEQHGLITTQVVRQIVDADIVVADLTGANPNVYYELGIADSFRIPVVRFVDKAGNLPFDAKPDRTIELFDIDGNIEVLQAAAARKTFEGFARSILDGDGQAESIVVVAQQRASIDLAARSGTPTEEMLGIILAKLEGAPGGSRTTLEPVMDAREALIRLWRQESSSAEVFVDGEGGFIVDVGYAPTVDVAMAIETKLGMVAGPQKIRYLHGLAPLSRDPVYGDEEPF